ncbi:hypothetical protein K461DRAFT_40943 [Myriangium duriaei CBS 260.36]|uniref:Rhodopsin domain-containing protein n=1 Tax=Myriangium duriaei CBS 260.36 TaxID=1168546 RepID=A0A9P4IUF9_9PEZI|nr:hypothetical protein K461DRAFT_40943 [Myriangium duriaei CBS 260.36]
MLRFECVFSICVLTWHYHRCFMLLLPLPILRSLHVPLRVKIGLAVTFLAGSLGLIASVARTIVFFKHDVVSDGTWTSPIFLIWTLVEPCCYNIVASLLCLKPLLSTFVSKCAEVFKRNKPAQRLREFFSSRRIFRSSRSKDLPDQKEYRPPVIRLRPYPAKFDDRYERQDDGEALVGREGFRIYV